MNQNAYIIESPYYILYDRSAASGAYKKLAIWSGAALLAQAAFAGLMYEAEYSDIISVRQYQSIEDVAHNKTTIALNECMLSSAKNYLDNWERLCKAYGLGEGCGLPKAKYALLTDGLNKDNAVCKADHVYATSTFVGPRGYQDEGGNPI